MQTYEKWSYDQIAELSTLLEKYPHSPSLIAKELNMPLHKVQNKLDHLKRIKKQKQTSTKTPKLEKIY